MTQTKTPNGISTLRFLRLCSRAPATLTAEFGFRRRWSFCARYLPGNPTAGLSLTRIRQLYREWFQGFPDMAVHPQETVIDGDRVAACVTERSSEALV